MEVLRGIYFFVLISSNLVYGEIEIEIEMISSSSLFYRKTGSVEGSQEARSSDGRRQRASLPHAVSQIRCRTLLDSDVSQQVSWALCCLNTSRISFVANRHFAISGEYRDAQFSTCPEDRPLIVQFCANDPEHFVKAAEYVYDHCDAICLNLG